VADKHDDGDDDDDALDVAAVPSSSVLLSFSSSNVLRSESLHSSSDTVPHTIAFSHGICCSAWYLASTPASSVSLAGRAVGAAAAAGERASFLW
jgi:hypothetical protein